MAPSASTDSEVAWTNAELDSPHQNECKQEKVRRMFAAIATAYDLNNRLHSLWRDQAWRRFAVKAARVGPGDAVLDVACGTGDLSEAFVRSAAGSVIGVDYTREMLDVAQVKRSRLAEPDRARLTYEQGDAQSLRFADATFDVVSIAFGIRNVQSPRRAIHEFRRVLRPGGRLVILEFTEPAFAPMRWFNAFYCRRIMPMTATIISGDRSGAYRYLPKSVQSFMPSNELCTLLGDSGFSGVAKATLSLGICGCYTAVAD